MANEEQNTQNDAQENENLDPAQPDQTPLEKVKEVQAKQQNREVEQERVDATSEVPGHSIPSDIRHHPQRSQY